jgi:DNA-binding Lrp family transcriptional regulator
LLDKLSPAQLSRQLRRLRDIGVIKRVAGTYRYYLTRIGRSATAALCQVTQSFLIPALIGWDFLMQKCQELGDKRLTKDFCG